MPRSADPRGAPSAQAVRASDVSLMAFRDLTRLLLLHGQWAYQRSCLIAQISFFKSWAFCAGQARSPPTALLPTPNPPARLSEERRRERPAEGGSKRSPSLTSPAPLQVLYAPASGFGGSSIYDPFSIAACNALLFLPICFYSLNRFVPTARLPPHPPGERGARACAASGG